jgi:hypothetical protein
LHGFPVCVEGQRDATPPPPTPLQPISYVSQWCERRGEKHRFLDTKVRCFEKVALF